MRKSLISKENMHLYLYIYMYTNMNFSELLSVLTAGYF